MTIEETMERLFATHAEHEKRFVELVLDTMGLTYAQIGDCLEYVRIHCQDSDTIKSMLRHAQLVSAIGRAPTHDIQIKGT